MPSLPTGINAASPLDANDASRLIFTNDTDETLSRALDDTPSIFQTMDSGLQITVDYRQQGRVDDTLTLSARIINGGTVLAAADSGGAFQTVSSNVTNTSDTTSTPTFGYTNTTANKTTWDGATLELQQTHSQTKGGDGCHVEVDWIELVGNYTASGTTFQESMSGSISPSGSLSLTVIPPSWDVYRPISDTSTGNWTTTPLWSKVDDDPTTSASESDVISTTSTGDECVFKLGTISTPETWMGWRIRIRARRISGNSNNGLSVRLVIDSTNANLQTATAIDSTLSTSWRWFETVGQWDNVTHGNYVTDTDLTDVAIAVRSNNFSGATYQVAAVELRIPKNVSSYSGAEDTTSDLAPFYRVPSFGSVVLPSKGQAGPWTIDGKQWIVGYESVSRTLWAFSSSSPSNGHNPSDWTREFPVGALGFPYGSDSPAANSTYFHRLLGQWDAFPSANGEIICIVWGDINYAPTAAWYGVDVSTGNPTHVNGSAGIFGPSTEPTKEQMVRIAELPSTSGRFFRQYDYSGSTSMQLSAFYGTADVDTVTSSPNHLFDLIGAGSRMHTFYGKTDGDETQGVRERTWTDGAGGEGTMESEPGSDTTTEDMARLGKGRAYDNGSVWRVVLPLPQADGGGITAITFDSATSPTENLETVSTRDAYNASYELSCVAVPVGSGTGTKMWVLWIDDASGGDIYAASRADGSSTWSDEGMQVDLSGVISATRLMAFAKDSATIALIASAGADDIYYYEIEAAPPEQTITVNKAAELETAKTVTPIPDQIIGVGKAEETEAAGIVTAPNQQVVSVVKAGETELVRPVGIGLSVIGAGELESANEIYYPQIIEVGSASETEAANAVQSTVTINQVNLTITGDADVGAASKAVTPTLTPLGQGGKQKRKGERQVKK